MLSAAGFGCSRNRSPQQGARGCTACYWHEAVLIATCLSVLQLTEYFVKHEIQIFFQCLVAPSSGGSAFARRRNRDTRSMPAH